MLGGRVSPLGNNLSSRVTEYLGLGWEQDSVFKLNLTCGYFQVTKSAFMSSGGLSWGECQCHFPSFCSLCRYHALLLGLTTSGFPGQFCFQEPLCGISVVWSGSCCLQQQWYLQKESAWKGEGTMKSSSCPPSCQRLRHALVMLPCHQTASSGI